MPKIFEYFGFVFFFYSNEHEPIHVHVLAGGCETIYDLILENGELKDLIKRHGSRPALSAKDEAIADAFIRKYYKNIVDKWVNFFVYKKKIRTTKITKKL